jgi:hypothetical protein
LFLPEEKDNQDKFVYRPMVIGQLDEMRDSLPYNNATPHPFQVIGLRTDMKMKIFEWETNGFLVLPEVLRNVDSAVKIRAAIDFANRCSNILRKVFQQHFSGASDDHPYANPVKGTEALKSQMTQSYWQRLGAEFQEWILRFTPEADVNAIFEDWLQLVLRVGIEIFRDTAEQLNTGTSNALICEEAINHCRGSLYSYRNKTYPKEVQV